METEAGKSILAKDPTCPGTLGIAISEAVEDAAKHDNTHYALGSVLNHVLLHQTIIGLETQEQLKMAQAEPDVLIGCVGGGSNFGGLVLPYIKEKLTTRKDMQLIGVEPTSCPSLTKGVYAYDFGDTAMLTPLCKMYTLGRGFMPPGIHAGGLRYHGMAPIISNLVKEGLVEGRAVHQLECFQAAVDFARTEGLIVAPETSHALRAAVDEALKCKKSGEQKTIVFNCSGHGNFDMAAYEAYFAGKLQNYEYPESKVNEALKDLPNIQ
jgi:tryptophan synthase beta chain